MPSTKITLTKGSNSRTHVLDFTGLSGAILWALMGCLFLYAIAFSSDYWQQQSNTRVTVTSGLWNAWSGSKISPVVDWLLAIQILACLALGCIFLAVCLAFIYMTAHKFNKNHVLSALAASCFGAAAMLITIIVLYGVKATMSLHVSYALAVASTVLALGAGILSILQITETKKPETQSLMMSE